MKIGIIYGMEFAKPNGISRYVIELANCLKKENDVHLLISDNEFYSAGLMIHRSPLSKISGIKFDSNVPYLKSLVHICDITVKMIFNAFYNPYFSKIIKNKYDLDIIHSQSVDSFSADIVTMHACYKAARKNVQNSTKTLERIIGLILFSPFIFTWLFTEKNILKRSKKIIVVSNQLKNEILDNYKIQADKIEVIPNGIDVNKFKPDDKKRARIRKQYSIKEDEIVLIFVGHMFKGKGLDYILDAMLTIDKKIKLFVVGEDFKINTYIKKTVKAGIKDRVIFVGPVLSGIEDFYAASDIFLLPSASEGFPFSSLEAAASGLPIISTKVAGLEELVEEGHNGFFVRRNSEDIREKIQILAQNEHLRKQLGQNARETAKQYSWDEVMRKTLQVYNDVIRM